MKKVNPVTKGKSIKAEPAKKAVEKTVEKTAPVAVEEFKQEKLAETVKEEPVEEKQEETKTAPKKTAEKKTVEKKAVEKKAATEKKVAAVKEEVFVQFGNQEVFAGDVVERVKNAYIAEGHTAESIEKIRVYIKPEESMIYYVVNDDYASGISLF